jgi:hypothetical protein
VHIQVPSDRFQGVAAANLIYGNKAKSTGLVYEDDAYGYGLAFNFIAGYTARKACCSIQQQTVYIVCSAQWCACPRINAALLCGARFPQLVVMCHPSTSSNQKLAMQVQRLRKC